MKTTRYISKLLSTLLCCLILAGLLPTVGFAEGGTPADGYARITLVNNMNWEDGTGYQMLLDADADTFGRIIPENAPLARDRDATAEEYAEFEYKIPGNADGARGTSNVIPYGQSGSVLIPAGTYDYCITNPTPERSVYIATSYGNIPGRGNDYVFEAGKHYVFTTSANSGGSDQVDLTIRTYITNISAAITAPVLGATPDQNPTFTTDPADSMEFDMLRWWKLPEEEYPDPTGNRWEEMTPDEVFTVGYYYSPTLFLDAKSGFEVSPDATGTINNQPHDTGEGTLSHGSWAHLSIVFPPLTEHTHTAGTTWEHDEKQHWNLCTANDGEKMNVADHTPSDWMIDTQATATMNGTKHKECTVCKRTLETGTIPATGSSMADAGKPTSPATEDESNPALWIALLFSSGVAVIGMGAVCRRRKESY